MEQVELNIPLQATGQKLYQLCSVPNSIPRQKAYTYLLLIFITSMLIYFYSYPLTMEHWTFIKQQVINNVGFGRNEATNASDAQTYRTSAENTVAVTTSIFMKAIFIENNTTVLQNKLLMNAHTSKMTVSEEFSNDLPDKAFTKNINHIRNNLNTLPVRTSKSNASEPKIVFQKTSSVSSGYNSTYSTKISAINTTVMEKNVTEETTADEVMQKIDEIPTDSIKIEHIFNDKENAPKRVTATFKDMTDKETKNPDEILDTEYLQDVSTDLMNSENDTSRVQKGYLVFSENCRIPDIDPWHPSILKYIDKTPPLNCSEDYKPLTRTDGNRVILDEKGIVERTAGENYTCCYKSIVRVDDGTSDNKYRSSDCINMFRETTVKDEFIHVICKYRNGTKFYEEFYSFIFDKPKVEERCHNASKSLYSVLIIGADSTSRLNMHRQLNATANYLLHEMEAIEMYGYNKVGDNTFPNLVPLLTGYDERELPDVCWKSHRLPLDSCTFLWNRFAKNGYRTFYAEDAPHISTFNYVKNGFYHQPTDYYFRPFILAYENRLGRDKPLNCYQCVGSTSETEAILNWAKQFAMHFSDRPYFAFSWINSLTHDFLNLGSAGDYMYESFFRQLHQTGALNRTIVILVSDHGMRWGSIRNTYVGRLEERLPMLLIALPQTFKQEHPYFAKILKDNSHRLVTPYDLHATLRHLLNMTEDWMLENTENVDENLSYNFTSRAWSLFQPIPVDRSCDDAFIEEHWCTCEASLDVDVESEEVHHIANFLISHINKLLKSSADLCAVLKLDLILGARLWQPPNEHVGHSVNDDIYTVVIQANPSKAVFEGTVKISKPSMSYNLLGTISRLNLYGNQSSCIQNAILKKYCYCL